MWEQVWIGAPLVLAFLAASTAAALSGRHGVRETVALWVVGSTLAFAAVALPLAVVHWVRFHDWMHLLWTSTHPQLVVFAASGAFLVRDARHRLEGARGHGAWLVLGLLALFALLPLVLIEVDPNPNAGPRDVGRALEGTVEVALFGIGGQLPAALVPFTPLGERRGMGFLPREITVPVGALATAAVLCVAVCAIRLASTGIEAGGRPRLLLLAPFAVAAALLALPMPIGVDEATLWPTSPLLVRGFGPVLLLAVAAVVLTGRLARRAPSSESRRT